VLLLREPVDRIQEEILIPLDAEGVVGGEIGIAEGDNAAFRLRRVRAGVAAGGRWRVGGRRRDGSAKRNRSLLVALLGVELHFARREALEVRLCPALRA